ncbi:MAG TPA: hypothetical protein VHZ96_14465, partial [Frankiaceae bacterium]|nr:hypothetical protein [Frankiaceae bacterium]
SHDPAVSDADVADDRRAAAAVDDSGSPNTEIKHGAALRCTHYVRQYSTAPGQRIHGGSAALCNRTAQSIFGSNAAEANDIIERAIGRQDFRKPVVQSSGRMHRVPSAEILTRRDQLEGTVEDSNIEVVKHAQRCRVASLPDGGAPIGLAHAVKAQFLDHLDAGVQLDGAGACRRYNRDAGLLHGVRTSECVRENCGVHEKR